MEQNQRTYEKRINAVVQADLSVLAEQEIRWLKKVLIFWTITKKLAELNGRNSAHENSVKSTNINTMPPRSWNILYFS